MFYTKSRCLSWFRFAEGSPAVVSSSKSASVVDGSQAKYDHAGSVCRTMLPSPKCAKRASKCLISAQLSITSHPLDEPPGATSMPSNQLFFYGFSSQVRLGHGYLFVIWYELVLLLFGLWILYVLFSFIVSQSLRCVSVQRISCHSTILIFWCSMIVLIAYFLWGYTDYSFACAFHALVLLLIYTKQKNLLYRFTMNAVAKANLKEFKRCGTTRKSQNLSWVP